jgi:hypothetical protein
MKRAILVVATLVALGGSGLAVVERTNAQTTPSGAECVECDPSQCGPCPERCCG